MPTDYDEGFLVGLLVGEGHFGGDGRQPHVTLRMHERHEPLFRWIDHTFPGGRVYGPYDHGGRRYYQWMARGSYLRDVLVPLLERRMDPRVDLYAHARFEAMRARYHRQLGAGGAAPPLRELPPLPGDPAGGRGREHRRAEPRPPQRQEPGPPGPERASQQRTGRDRSPTARPTPSRIFAMLRDLDAGDGEAADDAGTPARPG